MKKIKNIQQKKTLKYHWSGEFLYVFGLVNSKSWIKYK